MLEERRVFPRAYLKYKINIICEGTVILGGPKDYIFHTYTENIGEGGIKVVLEKELKLGSLLKLELFITSKKMLPIECKGMVVWTKKINPQGTKPDLFATGIKFIELSSSVGGQLITDIVNRYLDKIHKIK
jgi:Tfp pilus assembly protein PilZ